MIEAKLGLHKIDDFLAMRIDGVDLSKRACLRFV